MFFKVADLSTISTSNHMFGRAIWDKLSECIFENFEIARVKRGWFIQKMGLLVNHTKPTICSKTSVVKLIF